MSKGRPPPVRLVAPPPPDQPPAKPVAGESVALDLTAPEVVAAIKAEVEKETAGLKGNRDELLKEAKAAKAKLAAYEGIDPEEHKRLKAAADEAERRMLQALHDALSVWLAACDAVWTMTSLLGFEALLRGKPVTCLGAPFYAGWGLTRDLGPVPDRRATMGGGAVDLATLAHAALIGYPRYWDPVSARPCHQNRPAANSSKTPIAPNIMRFIPAPFARVFKCLAYQSASPLPRPRASPPSWWRAPWPC